MAFKMKLGSKNLDGPYSMSNTQTDTIKKGSGGLGMAGQVPDGQGSQGEAMSPHFQRGGKKFDTVGGGEVTEEYMSGVTRRGESLKKGMKINTPKGDKLEVIDENNSPQSTRIQKGRGVKIQRTAKKKTKYYPENHEKARQIIPPTNINKDKN